jgi:hypothetical protein
MKYKTKQLIFDRTTCYTFLNQSSVAKYLGVSRQYVSDSIILNKPCKGHMLEKVDRIMGSFFYEEDFYIYAGRRKDI